MNCVCYIYYNGIELVETDCLFYSTNRKENSYSQLKS